MANSSTEGRVGLPPIRDGVRECWVTVLHDTYLNADVLIGAGTKQACKEAFDRYSGGAKCEDELIYHVAIRKAEEPTP